MSESDTSARLDALEMQTAEIAHKLDRIQLKWRLMRHSETCTNRKEWAEILQGVIALLDARTADLETAMRTNAKFRHLKRVCLSYMNDMTLGELQQLAVYLMQRPKGHFPPAPRRPPPPPEDPDGLLKIGF